MAVGRCGPSSWSCFNSFSSAATAALSASADGATCSPDGLSDFASAALFAAVLLTATAGGAASSTGRNCTASQVTYESVPSFEINRNHWFVSSKRNVPSEMKRPSIGGGSRWSILPANSPSACRMETGTSDARFEAAVYASRTS